MFKGEYPRPNFQREKFMILNGSWDFDFDDLNVGLKEKWYKTHEYEKKINVPFAFQTKLSGINDQGFHDYMWYHTTFVVPKTWKKEIFLNFQAVDYECIVFINGNEVFTHKGGNTKFSINITNYIKKNENDLVVYVYDPSTDETISRGKQAWELEPSSIWYDRTSGIYQTVWIEEIDRLGIKNIKITPDIDNGEIILDVEAYENSSKVINVLVIDNGNIIQNNTYSIDSKLHTLIKIWGEKIFERNLHDSGKTWSPENPYLYDIVFELKDMKGKSCDKVKSYFGMRKISCENGKILLNNRPYFLKMVLNQGYFRNSLLTAPNDELLVNDIKISKEFGFNGCRIHQKVEEERFLYYADKLGFLTTLELPSAQIYSSSLALIDEWVDMVKRDYNHPSLIMYVPFNESWGIGDVANLVQEQMYVNTFVTLTKSIDNSKLVVSNDGWEQTIGDVCAIHNYSHGSIGDLKKQNEFKKSLSSVEKILSSYPGKRDVYARNYSYNSQPIILSEFGGISFKKKDQNVNGWGYTSTKTEEEFLKELNRLFDVILDSNDIVGFCYTQLTDVMQEINGLCDYDRNFKIKPEDLKRILDKFK
ncbi:MAG: hypothetical protein LBV58_04005 [Acholeplasmatales bacterium]|jgi:beta-galactosidase/beta-glucuronidase|nr:hypothetical protein [Acholeplasmatales bacterium]